MKYDILANNSLQILACQLWILKSDKILIMEDAEKLAYGRLYRVRKKFCKRKVTMKNSLLFLLLVYHNFYATISTYLSSTYIFEKYQIGINK